MEDFLAEDLYILKGKRTGLNDRDYVKLISQSISRSQPIELTLGAGNTANPMFKVDKNNPASGYKFLFDPSMLSMRTIASIYPALSYSFATSNKGSRGVQHKNEILKIENALPVMRDQVIKSYDRLYDILWDAKDDDGNLLTEFDFNMRYITDRGWNRDKYLPSKIHKSYRGSDMPADGKRYSIQLDRNNPTSVGTFNKKLASAVILMAKYDGIVEVREGIGKATDIKVLLVASLSKIYSEDSLKVSTWTKPSSPGKSFALIAGSITFSDYAKQNMDKWRDGYTDEAGVYHPGWNEGDDGEKLWTWANRIPIYCFTDRHDFNGKILKIFKERAGTSQRYSGIDKKSFVNLEP